MNKLSISPLSTIQALAPSNHQQLIRLRARVFSKKDCGKVLFLILRDGIDTLQAVAIKSKEEVDGVCPRVDYNVLRKIENESFIEIVGQIIRVEQAILACSQRWIELNIIHYTILSRAVLALPIALKEIERIEEQTEEHACGVALSRRLDHRVLDLRTTLAQAIFRINDGLLFYFQQQLRERGFIEIKTPKLIAGGSEGGAQLFKLDYFGRQACLAQSPQLYKQMAILSDFKKVFEIGPVFRSERSHTHRHLTEFIGVDIEMVIDQSYMEVVQLLYQLFVDLFKQLQQKYRDEIAVVQACCNSSPLLLSADLVVISFSEAVALLQAAGYTRNPLVDFSTEEEWQLSLIIKEKYQTDLYVVTSYPICLRPFYTMPDGAGYSYSYDFILRGREVLSGAQRIDDYGLLVERVRQLGIDVDTLRHYLEGFQYGVPPHAGAGIGLERLLQSFLGLPDIRYASLFPRDPQRLFP